MTTQEFRKRAIQGGHAEPRTIEDYTELHDEPYTEDDIIAVTQLQDWRDAHDPYGPYYCKRNEDYEC